MMSLLARLVDARYSFVYAAAQVAVSFSLAVGLHFTPLTPSNVIPDLLYLALLYLRPSTCYQDNFLCSAQKEHACFVFTF